MATVTTRTQLGEHAFRALGAPVIDINVDDDQLEDRIDDAIQFYQEYHSDAIQRVYYKHQLLAADVTNSYIELPNTITSIVRLLDMGQGGSVESLFNVNYHMRLQDMWSMSAAGSKNLQLYTQRMSHLALLDDRLNSTELLRYNRHTNKLWIDEGFQGLTGGVCSDTQYTSKTTCETASETWTEGSYIIIEAYQIVDPTATAAVYNDMFLKRYVTSLVKRQWGQNLIKFEGMQLPGGVTMNGQLIYDQAQEEILKIEEEMQLNYQLPDDFLMG